MFNINLKGKDYYFSFKHEANQFTYCDVYKGEEWLTMSIAECSPKDNFNKNTGRKVALTHLLNGGMFDKEERSQIWDRYFETRNGKF